MNELEKRYHNNSVPISCIIPNNAGVTRLFRATSLWESSHNEPFFTDMGREAPKGKENSSRSNNCEVLDMYLSSDQAAVTFYRKKPSNSWLKEMKDRFSIGNGKANLALEPCLTLEQNGLRPLTACAFGKPHKPRDPCARKNAAIGQWAIDWGRGGGAEAISPLPYVYKVPTALWAIQSHAGPGHWASPTKLQVSIPTPSHLPLGILVHMSSPEMAWLRASNTA